MKKLTLILLICSLALAAVLAQRLGGSGGRSYGRGRYSDFESARTAREITQHGNETPSWTNASGFESDVFTFLRIKRDSRGYGGYGGYRGYGRSGGPWWTDAPDSDLNLAYRLQQMTALKVDPDGRFLRLTEKELARYPFIYMVEPGSLYLTDEEIVALRTYLLNGGFLWLDDFWGDSEWNNVEQVMKQVFRDRDFIELEITNPLYHCVFDIKAKSQIPNVEVGTASEYTHVTWEYNHDGDTRTVHHRAIFDDKGRLMVLATHNTDNGDGWEWEGDNHYYFEHFAEKIAYPLAVNVIFYVMTH
jgi:hypothetical protein